MNLDDATRQDLAAFLARRYPTAEARETLAGAAGISVHGVPASALDGWRVLILRAEQSGRLVRLADAACAGAPDDANLAEVRRVLAEKKGPPWIAIGGIGAVALVVLVVAVALTGGEGSPLPAAGGPVASQGEAGAGVVASGSGVATDATNAAEATKGADDAEATKAADDAAAAEATKAADVAAAAEATKAADEAAAAKAADATKVADAAKAADATKVADAAKAAGATKAADAAKAADATKVADAAKAAGATKAADAAARDAHGSPIPSQCRGAEGALVGYWYAGSRAPGSAGETISLPSSVNIRADYPHKENRYAMRGKVLCSVSAGTRQRLSRAPIDVGGGNYWVPVWGGDLG